MTKDDLVSKDTALKMAIEAMEGAYRFDGIVLGKAINACKKALEQPTQEPVIDAVDTVVTYGKYEVDETQEPIVDAVESLNQD